MANIYNGNDPVNNDDMFDTAAATLSNVLCLIYPRILEEGWAHKMEELRHGIKLVELKERAITDYGTLRRFEVFVRKMRYSVNYFQYWLAD